MSGGRSWLGFIPESIEMQLLNFGGLQFTIKASQPLTGGLKGKTGGDLRMLSSKPIPGVDDLQSKFPEITALT